MIDVCLLGTAGTIPLPKRRLSAALVWVGGSLLLSLGFSGKGADEPLTVYGPPPSRTCCGACSS
jgi:hypothetical protein